MKKHLLGLIIGVALMAPVMVLAQTTDTAALIQRIREQVAVLQQQIADILAKLQTLSDTNNTSNTTSSNTTAGTGGVTLSSVSSSFENYRRTTTLELIGTDFTSKNIIKIDNGYYPKAVASSGTHTELIDSMCVENARKTCEAQGVQKCLAYYTSLGGDLLQEVNNKNLCQQVGSVWGKCSSAGSQCPTRTIEAGTQISTNIGWNLPQGVICSTLTLSTDPWTGPGIKIGGQAIILNPGAHQVSVQNANGTSNSMTWTFNGPSAIQAKQDALKGQLSTAEFQLGGAKGLVARSQRMLIDDQNDPSIPRSFISRDQKFLEQNQALVQRWQETIETAQTNIKAVEEFAANPTNTSLPGYKVVVGNLCQ